MFAPPSTGLYKSPSKKEEKSLRYCRSPTAPAHLNESPPQKEGKSGPVEESAAVNVASMKVPTRVGKCVRLRYKNVGEARASMKAPPNRKGNSRPVLDAWRHLPGLNESPSKKGRETLLHHTRRHTHRTSMKKVYTSRCSTRGPAVTLRGYCSILLKVPPKR